MIELAFDAVWINGSVGTGKTTTAEKLGDELNARGVPGAVIDVDQLRNAWPTPADDRFNERLALENLTAVVANFRRSGAHVVVAAGVIEDPAAVAVHARALAANRLLLVRLTSDPGIATARLHARHMGDRDGLDWHLERHPQLATILDAAGFADEMLIDTSHVSAAQVASRIADLVDGRVPIRHA